MNQHATAHMTTRGVSNGPVASSRRRVTHIPVGGLPGPSWAMTEQLRATSREHPHGRLGQVDEMTLDSIRSWIRDFLEL